MATGAEGGIENGLEQKRRDVGLTEAGRKGETEGERE